jgi:hypothetical protein
MQIKPGEEIHVGNGMRLRVLDVVPFDEEDDSPFVGTLRSRWRSAGSRKFGAFFEVSRAAHGGDGSSTRQAWAGHQDAEASIRERLDARAAQPGVKGVGRGR